MTAEGAPLTRCTRLSAGIGGTPTDPTSRSRTSGRDEGPCGGQHARADLIQVTVAEKPSRGPIIEIGVQALKPGLDDAWFLPLTEQESNAKRQSEAALDVVGLDLAGPVRPLMHSAGFPDVSDEGDQPRGQQLSKFTDDGIERLARCFDVRSAVRPICHVQQRNTNLIPTESLRAPCNARVSTRSPGELIESPLGFRLDLGERDENVDESPQDDEIVMVPVPKKHLARVYAALASSMAPERPLEVGFPPDEPASHADPGPKPDGEAVLVDKRNGWWTPDMLRLLHARLTYAGARAVVRMTAEAAPKEVTLAEVSDSIGIGVPQLRAELGAMTKLCKKLYNGSKTWPFSVRWTLGGVANYSMDQRIARWWLDFEADDDSSAA